jgi:hypothetical protein
MITKNQREKAWAGMGAGVDTTARTQQPAHSTGCASSAKDGTSVPGAFSSRVWSRNGEVTGTINLKMEAFRLTLSYRQRSGGEDWRSLEYPVGIEWTPCNYGGERAWFLCPARGCGRRVAILYGGKVFACCRCYRLAYESQQEDGGYRAVRRTQKIRIRLGGSGSMADHFPSKPKEMHWRTYHRFVMKACDAQDISEAATLKWLNAQRFKL